MSDHPLLLWEESDHPLQSGVTVFVKIALCAIFTAKCRVGTGKVSKNALFGTLKVPLFGQKVQRKSLLAKKWYPLFWPLQILIKFDLAKIWGKKCTFGQKCKKHHFWSICPRLSDFGQKEVQKHLFFGQNHSGEGQIGQKWPLFAPKWCEKWPSRRQRRRVNYRPPPERRRPQPPKERRRKRRKKKEERRGRGGEGKKKKGERRREREGESDPPGRSVLACKKFN